MNLNPLRILLIGLFVLFVLVLSTPALATAPLHSTLSATASSLTASTIKKLRVAPDGTIYVVGLSTTGFVSISSDGSTAQTINYSVALPAQVATDFVTDGTSIFLATTAGSNGRLARFDISGTTASSVNALTVSGTGSIAFTPDGNILSTRSTGVKVYDTSLSQLSSTNVSQSVARTAMDGNGILYYLGSGSIGSLVKSTDLTSATETTLVTALGNTASANSLYVTPDGSVAYVVYNTSIRKYLLGSSSATLLWTLSYASNLAGMDINASGTIFTVDTSGTVKRYSPINSLTDLTATPSGASINLSWTTGVSDADFAGVTIRRSTSAYPTSPTDGVAVTSDLVGSSYSDSGLAEGTTYYYTLFNKTLDGFYDVGSQISATTSTAPSPPSGLTASASGSSVNLNWTNPVSNFDSVTIRRSSSAYPTSISDGVGVQSGLTDTTYSDTGLADGTYYYSLFATDGFGLYSDAATVSVTVDGTPTAAITSFAALVSGSNINLTWTNPVDSDFSSVTIRRNTSSAPTSITDGTLVAQGITGTSQADLSLPDGFYYYGAFAKDGFGNVSSVANVTVTVDTTAPSAPTLAATATGSTVQLNWDAPATTANFKLRRSTSGYPSYLTGTLILTTSDAATTTYADTSLTPVTYYYSVFALDAFGNVSGAGQVMVVSTGTMASVTTDTAVALGKTTAGLSGSVSDIGTSAVSERGFEYGETTEYGSSTSETGSFGVEAFEAQVSELSCGTTYHVRAYATNGTGTAYGEDATFTTSACADASDLILEIQAPTDPVVVNSNAIFVISVTNPSDSDIDQTSITLNLSGNLEFVSAEIVVAEVTSSSVFENQSTLCAGTNPISCELGTIAASESITLNITVKATAAGPVSLGAATSSEGGVSSTTTTSSGGTAIDQPETENQSGGGCSINSILVSQNQTTSFMMPLFLAVFISMRKQSLIPKS